MKKLFLFLFLSLFLQIDAQNDKFWKSVPNDLSVSVSKNSQRESFPENFKLFQLNRTLFTEQLSAAANRFSGQKGIQISLPNTAGNLERFEVFEASNFSEELQAQFPFIRSYFGKGIDDKTAQTRISVDPNGIQVMTFRADKKTEFMESYSADGLIYAIYTSSRTKGKLPFTCSTEDHKLVLDLNRSAQQPQSNSGELLIFRLALSCNGEYTQYFGGTVAGALAAMNASMTRVNGVFEKDFSIHMDLIPNNTSVIYTNAATDPYTNMGSWNGQLQTTLTTVIGEANYDVGHMFGATGGGGNAGCIGCVCVNGQKGSGITSPADGVPAGDTFDIDYVAHELGHQFGANHTFSHNVEGSGVNVEPGSGSTIMGYAGITNRDVQQNSDDYFVYASIKQVQDNMVGKTCPTRITLTNAAPTVNAGADYVIPKSTPFVLSGSAVDPNGDVLTYCWEQNDSATTQTGANSAASATKTGGPNWRSYTPVSSPNRYCPPLTRVVANQSTTQGSEIVVEALNSVARTMNFVLTARDNFSGAGQTGSDAMVVTVNAVAGPFLVTNPNTAATWPAGSNQSVTWDVAGTTANGVNATYVDIYLSTDGGFNYPYLLASQVPNDGSEVITVPNQPGMTNRIMVKGNNHIFYDISNANFSISSAPTTFSVAFNGIVGEQNKSNCTGADVSYTIPYSALGGFSGTTTFSVTGQPAGSTATFSPASTSVDGSVVLTISDTQNATPGFYSMIVTAESGAETKTVPLYFQLFDSNFNGLNLNSPANFATGQPINVTLTWTAIANATAYDVQVASDMMFTNIIASTTVFTNSYTTNGLAEVTDYYWRVLPKNISCSGVFTEAFTFGTGQVVCSNFVSTNVPVTIPTTANVTVNSTLVVPDTMILSDVNVTVNIAHTWVNDMTITLISPAGTQVQLVANPCVSDNLQNIQATFDDSGNTIVCATNPAISGVVKSVQQLSAFNGQSATGTWTLRVLDSFNQDGGAINGWSLNLCSTQQPMSVSDYSQLSISVYPNPSNGNFTVQYTSATSNPIAISVYDMRGRAVYTKTYENTGMINQPIALTDVQSGVYLMTVVDGNQKGVKRIVIQ
ncbi:reprolysin-like metallopeptidase [Flavobacterium sp.]|uniref:zinc-dependent metalloprotease n=1 Tax=Flavobacterium sp. TaxID=239 RepID=UPI0025BD5816|nr:zinc-dependent metalloprotease family protein [Flavobacterium sp.]MBA4155352.1 secretion protein [Flavobacterium sp.]